MIYIDLETTVDGGPDGDSPEAHWVNNKVILCGWKNNNQPPQIDLDVNVLCNFIQKEIDNAHHQDVWVAAHNAKFDLKYLMRDRPDVDWHKVRVWDSMTWEYLYSGHADKFISLVKACAKHNIVMKKSLDLGALLATGVKMQDIPIGELTSYLSDDVYYLRQLYLCQHNKKYWPDMDYILPLCEMELNGLPIDNKQATALGVDLSTATSICFNYMVHQIRLRCEWQDGTPITEEDFTELLGTKSKTIKPMSNRTLSFLLFNEPSELKITPKWRVQYNAVSVARYPSTLVAQVYTEPPGDLGYPVSEEDLERVRNTIGTSMVIDRALEYRSKHKLLGTYISPFLHTSSVQGTIHPKLNTTVTNTGRLSSSGPNGQNVPPPARKLVIPSDPRDEIVEIDFKQLEMVGAAAESLDPTMIQDLRDGEDLHFNTGKKVMGWNTPADMTKEKRTLVKNVNFGVLYGGKANGLSHQTGLDKKVVQELIDSFYTRYPKVATWQTALYKEVTDNLYPYDIKEGEQRYASMYTLPISNRKFLFVEAKSPEWMRRRTGRRYSFSPQHTANYPIQGFAGGDLVMSALHYLWCAVLSTDASDYIKFRMTVHDSIVLQVRKGINLDLILEKMCKYVKDRYNLPVDLHVDVDVGSYWQ